MPYFCPSIFFPFWHYIPLDNYSIDHSYILSIYEKTVNHTNSWKVTLVGKKVPYKFPNDIASKLSTRQAKIDDLCVSWKMANYLNSHSSDTTPKNKFLKICILRLHMVTHMCQFMGQNFEICEVKKFDKDLEKQNLQTRSPARSPQCVAPPQKWYHHMA